MAKSPKYTILINGQERFSGRLIGFINDEECKAVLNTVDAARRIFTAPGIKKSIIDGVTLTRKRFVIVTDDINDGIRGVFISPKVSYNTFTSGKRGLHCMDNNDYHFEEVVCGDSS